MERRPSIATLCHSPDLVQWRRDDPGLVISQVSAKKRNVLTRIIIVGRSCRPHGEPRGTLNLRSVFRDMADGPFILYVFEPLWIWNDQCEAVGFGRPNADGPVLIVRAGTWGNMPKGPKGRTRRARTSISVGSVTSLGTSRPLPCTSYADGIQHPDPPTHPPRVPPIRSQAHPRRPSKNLA